MGDSYPFWRSGGRAGTRDAAADRFTDISADTIAGDDDPPMRSSILPRESAMGVEAAHPAERARSRYEGGDLLGAGAMGEVRVYRDRQIGRDVAMKTMRAEDAHDPQARARFEQEARIQGQLEHPASILAFLVPLLLEAVGVLAPSLELRDGAIVLLPRAVDFPPVPTIFFLVMANVALIIVPALMATRVRDYALGVERHAFTSASHLRQMLPRETRAAMATDTDAKDANE